MESTRKKDPRDRNQQVAGQLRTRLGPVLKFGTICIHFEIRGKAVGKTVVEIWVV